MATSSSRPKSDTRRPASGHTRPFVLILLLLAFVLIVVILRQFIVAIIFAVLLALLAGPTARALRERAGLGRNLASGAVVGGTFVIVVLPVFAFLFLLVTQGASLLQEASQLLDEEAADGVLDSLVFDRLQQLVEQTFPDSDVADVGVREQLASLADSAVRYLVDSGVTAFGNLADIVAKFFIMLFLLFYLVRDGARMGDRLRELLPLRGEQVDRVYRTIRDMTHAVVFGTLVTAVVEGVLGGIGFWIVGLPGLVWAPVISVASLVPVVGTGLVTVPAVLYLLFSGLYWQSAVLAVWSAVIVGGVDNYLRPFFMRGESRLSPFYIFLAIVGGLATFGLAGLVLGPLAIAVAAAVVDIYRDEFRVASRGGRGSRPVWVGNRRPGWRETRLLRRRRESRDRPRD